MSELFLIAINAVLIENYVLVRTIVGQVQKSSNIRDAVGNVNVRCAACDRQHFRFIGVVQYVCQRTIIFTALLDGKRGEHIESKRTGRIALQRCRQPYFRQRTICERICPQILQSIAEIEIRKRSAIAERAVSDGYDCS